ncbi:hypothetical protein [Collimonas sp.]|jgi:hypothetical protein|uniref:hypothetical protein n=1 Tax=Collimonas sp. TaxID=1963772 RepID=UPI002C631B8E|nr:hypothetical protein [Collimonas sp.]HWW07793.1 hypothetical protein [Collimonas sp.]
MNELPEPIKSILRDYCHVEWFEVDELADDVRNGHPKFNVAELKDQFEWLISTTDDICQVVNDLTLNEFESMDEVHTWLDKIYQEVFQR